MASTPSHTTFPIRTRFMPNWARSMFGDRTVSTSTPTSLNSEPFFDLFPKLPTELRVKIWRFCIPGPRLVEVRVCTGGAHEMIADCPAMLHTCRESREEALKVYELFSAGDPAAKSVYFNYQTDTLYPREAYISPIRFRAFIDALPGKERFQNVALHSAQFYSLTPGQLPLILSFPNLKQVIVFVHLFPSDPYHLRDRQGPRKICWVASAEASGRLEMDYMLPREYVSTFLRQRRSDMWTGVEWREPSFMYMGVCRKDLCEVVDGELILTRPRVRKK